MVGNVLHARPCAHVARAAAAYEARTYLESERYPEGVNAASIMFLIAAAFGPDEEVAVVSRGRDAEAAVTAVARALEGADLDTVPDPPVRSPGGEG